VQVRKVRLGYFLFIILDRTPPFSTLSYDRLYYYDRRVTTFVQVVHKLLEKRY